MITSTDGAVTMRPPPGPRRILATFWSSTRRTASRNTARLVPYRWSSSVSDPSTIPSGQPAAAMSETIRSATVAANLLPSRCPWP